MYYYMLSQEKIKEEQKMSKDLIHRFISKTVKRFIDNNFQL